MSELINFISSSEKNSFKNSDRAPKKNDQVIAS